MKRLIVHTTDGTTANLRADEIRKSDDFIEVYFENILVGMFDKGSVQFCYLSSPKE